MSKSVRPLLFGIGLLFASCAGVRHSGTWEGDVRVHGAFHAVLHEGKTGSVVRLETVLPDDALYAVGALADLTGEVTVVAGKVYLSYAETGGNVRNETPSDTDEAAALLIASSVPAWRTVSTQRAIPFEALDEEIGRLAEAAGMDLDARFPFVLEGRFRELEWHVLGGSPIAEAATSHEDHLAASTQLRLGQASATLVGFYSQKDEGVITHMGSKTHLHCVVTEPLASGHVDHVIVLAGTTVKFPVVPVH
jgi:hypothetical protein